MISPWGLKACNIGLSVSKKGLKASQMGPRASQEWPIGYTNGQLESFPIPQHLILCWGRWALNVKRFPCLAFSKYNYYLCYVLKVAGEWPWWVSGNP